MKPKKKISPKTIVLGIIAVLALVATAANAQRWLIYHPPKLAELNAEAERNAAQLANVQYDADGTARDQEAVKKAMLHVEITTMLIEQNEEAIETRRNYTLAGLVVFLLAAGLAFRSTRAMGASRGTAYLVPT